MPKLSEIKRKPVETEAINISDYIDPYITVANDTEKFKSKLKEKLKQTGRQRVDNGQTTGRQRVDERVDERVERKKPKRQTGRQRVGERVDKRVDNGQTTGRQRVEKTSIYDIVGMQKIIVDIVFHECQITGEKTTPILTLAYIYGKVIAVRDTASKGSVKDALNILLNKKKVLILHESKEGNGGWRKYKIPDHIFQELILSTGRQRVDNGQTTGRQRVGERVGERVDTPPNSSSLLNREIKKETTIEQIAPLNTAWQEIDMGALKEKGLTLNKMYRIAEKGILTPEQVQDSIFKYSFDIEKGLEKIEPYIFIGILMKGDTYVAVSKNYEDPMTKALRENTERREAVKEMEEAIELKAIDIDYSDWLESLSGEDKDQILKARHPHQRYSDKPMIQSILKAHHLENIWPDKKKKILASSSLTSH